MFLFNPSSDLSAVQTILNTDATILSLLDLIGKSDVEITKRIIKRSKWDDLANNDRRLCIFFRPARKVRNLEFNEEVLELDCHVPATLDYIAYQVNEQAHALLHKKKVNNRYLYFDGQLGELSTMPSFFCAGSRYIFYRKI